MINFLIGLFLGAIIGVIALALVQINRQSDAPVWYRTADRPPTKADADKHGKVWAYHKKYGAMDIRWSWVNLAPNDITHWTRSPGDPPGEVTDGR